MLRVGKLLLYPDEYGPTQWKYYIASCTASRCLFASFAGVTVLLEPAGQLAPVTATLHPPASEGRARATSPFVLRAR
jgi:hypothetical protein